MISTRKEHKKDWVQMSLEAARRHTDIQAVMTPFGYDKVKLGEAHTLLGEVKKWDSLHFEHIGVQKKATQDIIDARQQVNNIYSKHLKIARLALDQQRELWDLLKLEGRRKQSLSDWLGQVKAFYYNCGRAAEILNKYNITQDIVDQTKAMIEAIEDYRVHQSVSRSHAQEATQRRNKFTRELDSWMQEFMYVAKLALKNNPQYLEALGKTVK
ncbi:hypothetical protein [Catalinimonas niigatensis]|uniref:hypothetical protein n=1 Tax=Catalinimonas niigatensis TaxID=1397264 RepID=UPI00266560D9|nr:hypothetical protein [Catalinimonas niigatensis]WPP51113.1 hypothetical protein PZB72_01730 [Catalinimonas niigatensis]